jgi:hypothetical protein
MDLSTSLLERLCFAPRERMPLPGDITVEHVAKRTQLAGYLWLRMHELYDLKTQAEQLRDDYLFVLRALDPWQRENPLQNTGVHFCKDAARCPIQARAPSLGRLTVECKHLRDWIPLVGGDCMLNNPETANAVRLEVSTLVENAHKYGVEDLMWVSFLKQCREGLAELYAKGRTEAQRVITAFTIYHARYHEGKLQGETREMQERTLATVERQLAMAVCAALKEFDRRMSVRSLLANTQRAEYRASVLKVKQRYPAAEDRVAKLTRKEHSFKAAFPHLASRKPWRGAEDRIARKVNKIPL